MSSDSIVLNWLNNEIKLKPKVENIIEELSNGYKFGEILYKLKEISLEELKSLKKLAITLEEKKSNFSQIKKFFQKIYSLEIREEEFDLIIEKDISKAVIILYKLKNSIYKKKINFSNIKLFISQPKPEDIQKKVKEIMDNQYSQELTNKENTTPENISNHNDTYSSINKFISSRDNSRDVTPPGRQNSIILIKEADIRRVNEEINDNDSVRDKNRDSYYNNKEIKIMDYNHINYGDKNNNLFKSETKRKKFLPPLTPIASNTNIIRIGKDKNKKSLFGEYDSDRGKNIDDNDKKLKKLNKLLLSEEKDNKYKNYFNTEPAYDENKDEMLKKLRENLKKKIEMKKQKDKKKQEEIKKEFNYLNIYDILEIDFFKPEKNPLFKKRPPQMILSFTQNNRYLINSSSRRLKYSNDLKQSKEQEKLENRKEYYQKIFEKNSLNISKNLKKLKISTNLGSNSNTEEQNTQFNKAKYLKSVNKLKYNEYNEFIIKRHKQIKNDLPLIKEIIYLIIDYTVEGYFYQKENNIELINIPLFINLSTLFMNNKPAKEKPLDDEADLIKEIIKEDDLDINKLILTLDEQYLVEDYMNYCGIFNSKKIFDGEKIQDKFDIHIVNDKLPQDYEPTQNDIDDMCIPRYNTDNYIYGDNILEILDNKFGNNSNKNNKESKEKDNNNKTNNKWNNIPYKLSLIGYPLSGRKTLADNLVKKYPHLKIYSCQKILRDYYNTYKTLTEEIDINNPKYKSMKPNQIEQLKQEREKELQNFQPILTLIKPYIDQFNESTKDEINNNTDNNNENNNGNNDVNNNEVNSIIEKKFIPPSDAVLFEVLKNKIESDFPLNTEEENKNEIIEYQTKITNLNKQIEDIKKIISESNKPNPKDELALSNYEKEKQNLKQNYIKGFILVDYPTNLNQCILIENYLTGYISELEKPKTEKNIMIESLQGLIDFKFQPKENKTLKKSGIDFIMNIPLLENIIQERFNEIKYDPINDKIYTKKEINDAKQNIDKKIIERLVNEVPYLTKEIFDYYKNEYNDNISSINSFYNNFGMTISKNIDLNNLLEFEDEKEIRKTFQNLEISDNSEKNDTNKIIDFISEKLIDCIYNERDKSDKIIFYSKHPELNTNEETDRIEFAPEMEKEKEKEKEKENINQDKDKEMENSMNQRTTRKRRTGTKKGTRRGINTTMNEIKFMNNIMENSNFVLKKMIDFEIFYKKNIGGFVHLISLQRNDIYTRLNLIQKKFRDFLNYKTEKKKVLSLFTQKYNSFFSVNPKFFCTPKAIKDFTQDIDELNDTLWGLINVKQKECVKELSTIKNSGFIENELVKLYKNIKNLFLIETEKFLEMVDSIINLYNIKKDSEQKDIEVYKKEFIMEGTITIKYENKNQKKKKEDYLNKNDMNNTKFSHISEASNEDENVDLTKSMSDIVLDMYKNIELFFVNGMKLLYLQQNRTENLIKSIKEAFMQGIKKGMRRKNKNSNANESLNSSQLMVSMIGTKTYEGFGKDEKLRKMFQNEKSKYKYRIYYLKTFFNKYINIIDKTTNNIYKNADNWITQSVSLQNNALNTVIAKIREILNNQRLIDEKVDIEPIEMDAFELEEKNSNDDNKDDIILKPIDDKSVISNCVYNKINIDYLIKDNFINTKIEDININENISIEVNDDINEIKDIDFYFDINKFYYIYKTIKKYEIEENTISQNLLYEMFFKQYVLNIYNEGVTEEKKEEKINNNEKDEEKNEEKEEEKEEEEENKEKIIEKKKEKKKIMGICSALKNLNAKQIYKLFNLYQIHKEHHEKEENIINNNNIINSTNILNTNEIDENKIIKEKIEEEKIQENINEKEKEKNEEIEEEENHSKDNIKEEKKEEKKKFEYETYLKLKEIFTILSLIGCEILTISEEEKTKKELNDKIINNGYLTKNDYIEYNFWFEKNFDYQNNINEENNEWVIEDYKDKKMNIKELIFEIWKDNSGKNINIKQFLMMLKIGNYITDLNSNNNKKYYDIIFN